MPTPIAGPTRTLRSAAELEAAGLAPAVARVAIEAVAARYAVAITPGLAALVDPADPADPIARQFVPQAAELDLSPDELADPIGDDAHSPVEGIVHRYPDRVLLKPVNVCAVYCRFCFRREMVGPGRRPALTPRALDAAIAYIAARPEIWEVILTGGDPLVMSPRRLRELMRRLAAIDHVAVLRVHTRLPVASPELVTPGLVRALRVPDKATYVVLHANHPREMTPAVRAACGCLIDAGIPMLSQSVLLRGVNDDVATLEALMRSFVAARIKPYYLHHADLAPGTGHLRTSLAGGQALVETLRGRVSGLCQPAYVLDIPGGYGKVPVASGALGETRTEMTDKGLRTVYTVSDYQGRMHCYAEPATDVSSVSPPQQGRDRG